MAKIQLVPHGADSGRRGEGKGRGGLDFGETRDVLHREHV